MTHTTTVHDYEYARRLVAQDPPFWALVIAAMRRADTNNERALREAFPQVWEELDRRYHAPMALLEGESRPLTLQPQETVSGRTGPGGGTVVLRDGRIEWLDFESQIGKDAPSVG